MGYACPVCDDPQVDARHLANHLAFTAILGREDHEAWLDEHAPGWGAEGEAELADRVDEHAEPAEYPQVFEDTTDGHDHGPHHGRGHEPDHGHEQADVPRDPQTEEVLEEARELTRERRAAGDEDASDDDAETDEA